MFPERCSSDLSKKIKGEERLEKTRCEELVDSISSDGGVG